MGFLEKKLKKGLKKGMKEMGIVEEKKKKKKDKKHKKHHHAPPPPPGAVPRHDHHQASQVHPGSTDRMGILLQQLQSHDGDARKDAQKKLEKMFKKDVDTASRYVAQIIAMLGHPNSKVKQSAAKVIKAAAKNAPMTLQSHLDTLQRLLNDPDPKVREYLMDAVKKVNAMLGTGAPSAPHVTNIYHQTAPPASHEPHTAQPPAPAPPAPIEPHAAQSPASTPPLPSEVLETGKPGVHLDIIEEELPYKRWGMIRLKVENHSEVDLYNIKVNVNGPVEVSPIDTIHHIPAGESQELEIGMKAPEAGRVPAHLSAIYYDLNRREYKHSRQDWISVKKPEKAAASGTQINIGSIGDIVSDHSTKIQDSVIQRSNIGGGGGESGGGGDGGGDGGGGSTVIRGSSVQRSNISGGGNVEVEDSVMLRSNISGGGGGGGPRKCPQCGRELKEGWAMCPKCGTKI